ncbi:MAG: purine-nucleoside phosphorylase [Blastocatellia bacterium]|jgi:purine-nucleoside phosphorylase|nr:purine-nucleoside phosphorylase [Blastocatellia bacterium]
MTHESGFDSLYRRVEQAAEVIRSRSDIQPRIALVLGSGLGAFADELQDKVAVPYDQIAGFARSTVEGHAGQLVIGKSGGVPVVAMQGRFHYYEGYSLEQVVFPIRTFSSLGVQTVVLTNAAGGINIQLDKGALMVISDHLNLMGASPLRGPHDQRFGARFPDMTEVYARDLQEMVVAEAHGIGLEMRRGIYAALSGPSYETPAEIRMLRTLGADAVGMSTVPEAIVARQMGMQVLGISCITNLASGVADQLIDHSDVMETGAQVRVAFTKLLRRVIQKIGQ